MSYASSSVDTYSILLSHMIWKKSDGKKVMEKELLLSWDSLFLIWILCPLVFQLSLFRKNSVDVSNGTCHNIGIAICLGQAEPQLPWVKIGPQKQFLWYESWFQNQCAKAKFLLWKLYFSCPLPDVSPNVILLLSFHQAYASHLKDFIEHMGITILRHFKVH